MSTVSKYFLAHVDKSLQHPSLQVRSNRTATALQTPHIWSNFDDSMPDSDTSASSVGNVEIITTLQQSDILCGRGAFCISHVGNILFRELCSTRRIEYIATISRITKSRIAKEIINIVIAEGGRFLRRATSGEMQSLGHSTNTKGWILADKSAIMRKTKQAIREREYVPRNRGNVVPDAQDDTESGGDNQEGTVRPIRLAIAPIVPTHLDDSSLHRGHAASYAQANTRPATDNHMRTDMSITLTPAASTVNQAQFGDSSSNQGQIGDNYESWNVLNVSDVARATTRQMIASPDGRGHDQRISTLEMASDTSMKQNDTTDTDVSSSCQGKRY